MRAVVKEPGKPPAVQDINNDLAALQGLVGGYIEAVPLDRFILIVNEEGKLMDLPPNFPWHADVIVGTAVVVAQKGDDFRSLTEEEADRVVSLLGRW